jgi:hypothetical protein
VTGPSRSQHELLCSELPPAARRHRQAAATFELVEMMLTQIASAESNECRQPSFRPVAAAARSAAAAPGASEYLGRYLRFFDPVLRELLERGHTVHLVFERAAAPRPAEQVRLSMERHPRFPGAIPRRGEGAGSASPGRSAAPSTTSTSSRSGRTAFRTSSSARRRAPRTFKPSCGSRGDIGAGLAHVGEGADSATAIPASAP